MYVILTCCAFGTYLIPNAAVAAPPSSYKAACKTDADLVVMGFAYSKGWLLCNTADYYTGGEQLYHEMRIGTGVFTFIKGGGGAFRAEDLTELAGVPPATAIFLVRALPNSCSTCRLPAKPPVLRK